MVNILEVLNRITDLLAMAFYFILFYLKERRVNMNDKAKEKRNEYMRNYRRKNKEKIKIIQDRYWEKKAVPQ